MHVIAAKAVAYGEALRPEFRVYAQQVVDNAKALSEAMLAKGFSLVTGGTDNHLILADVHKAFGVDGKIAEEALDAINLTLNKNAVPDDPLPPFKPSGIRLGTPAVTTRGLVENDMATLADWMYQAITHHNDEDKITSLRQSVKEFCLQYPLPGEQ
jgi:glycine hydroxymethyltransferase